MTLACPRCMGEMDAESFLDGCLSLDPALATVSWACAACGATDPIQLEDGAVWLGYVYAAGTAHFARMVEIRVPGLSLALHPRSMEIRLGDRRWEVAAAPGEE